MRIFNLKGRGSLPRAPESESRKARHGILLSWCVLLAHLAGSVPLLAFSPLQPGEAVATCSSISDSSGNQYVMVVYDLRNPAGHGAVLDTNWAAPARHHPDWTLAKLGEVFGIAIDDAPQPNIYLTSARVYTQSTPGSGKVFKVDGATGAVSTLAVLPNQGEGLGNIAYDRVHQQFFVTDFYDGKIYRLSSSGTVLQAVSPSGAAAPVPVAQRVWGVGIFQNRVYYGTWGPPSQVFSFALDPNGALTGASALEVTLPPSSTGTEPISDLAFSAGGNLLVAERGMSANGYDPIAHRARILEFIGGHLAWTASPHQFDIGSGSRNSAGGVDSICPVGDGEGNVVATGDALHLGPNDNIYGLQILPAAGGNTANSFLVDLDNEIVGQDKNQIGDVEVYNTCDRRCSEVTFEKVLCTADGTGDFIVQFQIKNLSTIPAYHLFLAGLPTGVTANPSYFSLTNGLAPGQLSGILTTRIHGASPGQQISFQLTIHGADFEVCCSTNHTITLPKCDCAQVVEDHGPSCHISRSGANSWSYSFSLQNLFPGQAGFLLVAPATPATATFSPNVFDLSANPLDPGETQSFGLTIANAQAGQQVCFHVSPQRADFSRCCSILKCVTLPNCRSRWTDFWWLGDTVFLESAEGLELSSPTGTPGFSWSLHGASTASVQWSDIDAGPLASGAFLEQKFIGEVGGESNRTVATLRATRTAIGTALTTDLSALGATTYTYEFLKGGVRTGLETGVPADVPAMCNCGPRFNTDVHWDGYFPTLTFRDERPFRFLNFDLAKSFVADEVRVYPENSRYQAGPLSSLEMRAAGVPALTLTNVDLDFDCNHNGVPDHEDITRGGSRDFDGDGIPDECKINAHDLNLSLSTGFNQATGTPLPTGALPGGTDDDDWKVTIGSTTKPAKLVIAPTPLWPAPLPGSAWISVNPQRGLSVPGVSQIPLTNCFCLAADAGPVTLDLQLLADDRASVLLNGTALGGPGGRFDGSPLTVQKTGSVGDGLFRPGTNCLTVQLDDSGGAVTGLDLVGTVQAPNGACAAAAAAEN